MILIEIETITKDKVTINTSQIVSVQDYPYAINTTQIIMPGAKYMIPGKAIDFINILISTIGTR